MRGGKYFFLRGLIYVVTKKVCCYMSVNSVSSNLLNNPGKFQTVPVAPAAAPTPVTAGVSEAAQEEAIGKGTVIAMSIIALSAAAGITALILKKRGDKLAKTVQEQAAKAPDLVNAKVVKEEIYMPPPKKPDDILDVEVKVVPPSKYDNVFDSKVGEAFDNLNQTKTDIATSIEARHKEAAEEINDAIDTINKNSQRTPVVESGDEAEFEKMFAKLDKLKSKKLQ